MVSPKEILEELNIEHIERGDHHCSANWIQMKCPECNNNKNHLGWHRSGRKMNCWACGRKDIAKTLAKLANKPLSTVISLIKGLSSNFTLEEKTNGVLQIPKGVGPLQRQHRTYLANRGFDPDELSRLWEIKGISLHSKLAWRVFIPILLDSKIVSWTTRSINPQAKQRYKSAASSEEAIPHKTLLYGEDYCRHTVIVHEGPADVWSTGPGSVALFGIDYSRAQLLRLSKYPVRVICFDAQKEAQKMANKLADELSVFPGETYNIVLSDGKDAADPNASREIKKLRRMFLSQTGV